MADLTQPLPRLLHPRESRQPATAELDRNVRKAPHRAVDVEPLLTAEDVAHRLNVSNDWVWDHSSRKKPYLPVIRMGDGTLRYRASQIEEFVNERERLSSMRLKRA